MYFSFILLSKTINLWRRGGNRSTRRKPPTASFRVKPHTKARIFQPCLGQEAAPWRGWHALGGKAVAHSGISLGSFFYSEEFSLLFKGSVQTASLTETDVMDKDAHTFQDAIIDDLEVKVEHRVLGLGSAGQPYQHPRNVYRLAGLVVRPQITNILDMYIASLA